MICKLQIKEYYEQFLSLIDKDKVEEVKKFEHCFYTMFRPGTLSVCIMSFLIEMKNPEEEEYWKDTQDIISIFNP